MFLYEGWKEEYKNLIISIKEVLLKDFDKKIIFEVIFYRYIIKVKNRILEIYLDILLLMENEDRKFKYG